MGNYKSRPADYGNFITPVNLDLVKFVLDSKQQKYDYGLAKLQNKIDNELGSIDLARVQDKEYFLNRANDIMTSIGDTSSMDFSKSDVTRQVDNKLNNVVDDRVLDNVISTGNYRSFQRTLQEKQASGDGTYSQLNASHAMEKQGVNSWLNGETDNLGGVSYMDYTDVQAELKEIAENLHKYAHVIKQTTADGGIYFTTVEGKRLSSAEIQNIAKQQLSDKAKGQMTVNAWGKYDGGNEERQADLLNTFGEFSQANLKKSQTEIDSINLEIDSLGDSYPEEVKRLKELRTQATSSLTKDKELYADWMGNKKYDAMSSTLEATSVYKSFGDTYAFNDVLPSLSTNTATLAVMKMNLKAQEDNKSNNDVGDFNITKVSVEDYGERDLMLELSRKGTSYNESLEASTMQIFADLTESQQDGVLKDYDKDRHGDKYEYIADYLIKKKGNGVINDREKSELRELMNNRDVAVKSYNEAMNHGFNELEEGIKDTVISNLNSGTNSDIELLYEGNKIYARDLFRGNGIETAEDLNKNPKIKEAFIKSYYADKILSNVDKLEDSSFTTYKGEGLPTDKEVETRAYIKDPLSTFIPKSKKWMRESKEKMMADYEVQRNYNIDQGYDTKEIKDRLQKLLGEEDVEEFLETHRKLGLYDTISPWDNSVTDDNTINKAITIKDAKNLATEYVKNNLFKGGDAPLAISFSGDSEMGSDLLDVYGTGKHTVKGGNIQGRKHKDYSYSLWEATSETVFLTERINVKGEWTTNTVEVQKDALPQSVMQTINFNTTESMYNVGNMEEFQGKVSYSNINDAQALSDNTYFTNSEGLARGALTSQGVMGNLYRNNGHIMGTKVAPSMYGKAIQNFVDADNLIVRTKGNKKDGFNVQIAMVKPDESIEVLHTNNEAIPPELYDETWKKVTRVPQLYTTILLNSIMEELTIDPENPPNAMELIFENYGK